MENNKLINKKLGMFQRIRKSLLIRNIDKEKFIQAPEYLKNDSDVIDALVEKDPNNISMLPLGQKIGAIERNDSVFDSLEDRMKVELVGHHPEFISRLSENKAVEYIRKNDIFAQDANESIKFLPLDLQTKLLTEEVEYASEKFSSPTNYVSSLEYFSSEAVEKATSIMIDKAKKLPDVFSWSEKRRQNPFLTQMNIKRLPVETQVNLALQDNEFIGQMSDEAAEIFVGTNPIFFKQLSVEQQRKIVKQRPEYFSMLDNNAKRKLLMKPELIEVISDEDKILARENLLKYASYGFQADKPNVHLTVEQDEEKNSDYSRLLKQYICKNRAAVANRESVISAENISNEEVLLEIAQFEPKIMALTASNTQDKLAQYDKFVSMCKKRINSPEVINALEQKENSDIIKKSKDTVNLSKVLLNDRIIKNVSPEILEEYVRTMDNSILIDIVGKAYGERATSILKERPQITIDNISNLDIFDENIIEKFGIGTVHNMLTYNSHGAAILGDMSRHPEKLKMFDKFSEITDGYFKDTPLGFDNKLITYLQMEELFEKINVEEITPERKESLLLAISDLDIKDNETATLKIKNIEDIDEYAQKRNQFYDDYVEKSTSLEGIREAMAKRYFGMSYALRENYTQTGCSLSEMVHYYNLDTFIKDKRTQDSNLFTSDELDHLELATIINKIENVDVLKEIYTTLSQRDDVIKPLDFRETKEKVPQLYSEELVSSLFTMDEAKNRIENGEQGISYEVLEDEIEVVKLQGGDFRLLIHTTGMNNSNLYLPDDFDTADVWKYFENGCSTISGSVIESKMLKSCAVEEGVNLGFANVPSNQIIGMSHHDAHVSHTPNNIDPEFYGGSLKFNYPEELVRKTAAQITGQEDKDVMHEYNEVAMYRRNVNTEEIEQGTQGGRIMPDYIVVYGQIKEEHKKLAKKFSKEDKPLPIVQIDIEAYEDRTFERAQEIEDYFQDREKGDLIKHVKQIQTSFDER